MVIQISVFRYPTKIHDFQLALFQIYFKSFYYYAKYPGRTHKRSHTGQDSTGNAL